MPFHGFEITKVSVHPVKRKSGGGEGAEGPVKAYAKVVLNDQLAIHSLRVVEGKFGLFVSFPQELNRRDGKHYALFAPLSKDCRDFFAKRVLDEYQQARAA